jgi:predicted acyl esterase
MTTRKSYEVVYPNSTPPGVRLDKNVDAVMRDGVKIALDIYRPAGKGGPWPAILAYSSFPKERIFESAKPDFYCPAGYVCVQASERGIGQNQGSFSFQGPAAGRDGYDLIEWIARQPWCDGNVAMMGASGYGVMQWITAPLNPPHLKALVVLGTTDNYRGLCYPGGVWRKPFVQYLISGLTLGAIWPGPVPGKRPPMNILSSILLNHEDGPFWWSHGSGWRKIGRIKAPVFNIVQAPNRLHAISQLRSYADIRSPKKLLIAPWTSENYQPWIFETTAFNQEILRWLDYWLKGKETGIMNEPEVAIYDNGTGAWSYENEYPLARTRWSKYYLHSPSSAPVTGGRISPAGPDQKAAPLVFHNVSLNSALAESYGKNVVGAGGNQIASAAFLVYTSSPLKEDLKICGPLSLTLYAATTEEVTSDWCFFVKIGEMVAAGVPLNPVTGRPEQKPEINDPWTPANVQIWSWGSLKAKYRELDKKMSKSGMPWHSFRLPHALSPNKIYEFAIELQPIFKTFKKGSRIWLKIACDDALYSTRDASSAYVETPVSLQKSRISIYHSSQYPSHLLLPVISDDLEISPVAAPLRDALPGAPRFR